MGFGLHGIGEVSVGMDEAKLEQRERLVSTLPVLSSQVKRMTCVLPGLVMASRQETDLAESRQMVGVSVQRARVNIVPERVFQEREPLGNASRQSIRMPQPRCDPSPPIP